ncbi:MAG: tetratricopeptide repeat protein [Planctomycetaceae bacterium]|nr:tetratricopeptide repeat protein [Planctomycetaceae bacterium]
MPVLFSCALSAGLLWLGGCAASQPKPPAAEQQAAPEQPETQDAQSQAVSLYVDAMMLNDLNDREQALMKLNSSLELDPKFALAYSLKGDILQNMQRYEDSAAAYENATTYDPWSVKDFFNLGKVYQVLKQWARAAKAYVTTVQLDPKHYEANVGAAQSYLELKEYDNALAYAQNAKTLQPQQAEPEKLLGDVFEGQKDHVQAIDSYRRALELQGNTPELMISLARAYLRSGRYSSAKELLADVIAMEPQNGIAYQYLGFAQLKLKETQEAVESYRRAVEADQNDWMARKGLGVAYMLQAVKENNNEALQAQALEQWNISLQLKPDQPKLQQLIDRYSK